MDSCREAKRNSLWKALGIRYSIALRDKKGTKEEIKKVGIKLPQNLKFAVLEKCIKKSSYDRCFSFSLILYNGYFFIENVL